MARLEWFMTVAKRLSAIVALIAIAVVSLKLLQVHWGFDLTIDRGHRGVAVPLNVMLGWLSIGIALIWLVIEGYVYIRRRTRNE